MTIKVTDSRSNPKDQIATAAEAIGRSKDRKTVFEAICFGKSKIKSVSGIVKSTGLRRKRVCEEGRKLVNKQIFIQTTKNGELAYERDQFLYAHRHKIIGLAMDPKRLRNFPTKTNPQLAVRTRISLRIPTGHSIKTRHITIDDVDSFKNVRKVGAANKAAHKMSEDRFKQGIKRILGERGEFKDWPGERNDLQTSRLILKGKRCLSAFAFKGPGMQGKLTPARLGRKGDQIQRLFQTPAEIHFIQYHGQIDETVLDQMAELAKAKSLISSGPIFYGLVDGQDSDRLIAAYPKAFSR